MKSLDPRVRRLPEIGNPGSLAPKELLDQLGTYEVFVQPKEGKPFQHEGAVHAPDLTMAFVLAKETFTRRFTCVSLCVADTRDVVVSPITEGSNNIFELLNPRDEAVHPPEAFEIYHLPKRGKQMLHAGTVEGTGPAAAMMDSQKFVGAGKVVFGIWAIARKSFMFTAADEEDFWITLPEKKFRDASDYKGGDRLKNFIASGKQQP